MALTALLAACGSDTLRSEPTVAPATGPTPTAAPIESTQVPMTPPSVGGAAQTLSSTPVVTSVSTSVVTPAVTPVGFGTVAARTTTADDTVCELCLWLADDDASQGRGLMEVTDLGGKDGMAFVYAEPHTTAFYMLNTVMPLSIAFYGADGAFLDSFDMTPCPAEPCQRYPTPEGFTVAVEVPQGALDELGLVPDSSLTLDATPCPDGS